MLVATDAAPANVLATLRQLKGSLLTHFDEAQCAQEPVVLSDTIGTDLGIRIEIALLIGEVAGKQVPHARVHVEVAGTSELT